MIAWIIEKSVKNRFLIIVISLVVMAIGAWAMMNTPVDAIPDLSDVQVIVFTKFPGQSPQVVEDQVTYPLTTSMLSVPYAKTVRGYSFFGFSMVYVIFEDGTDLYWARSRVLEYLNFVQGRLPKGVNPELGPDATGVGWVYMYTLTSDRHDLAQLRSIQDWYLRYELMSLKGVSEVASAGGDVKQYQVEVDPEKLRAYGLTLDKVNMAIKKSNLDVGGRLIEMAETEFMVRGKGYVRSIEDLENIPIGVDMKTHTPILLSQVATIGTGPEIRRGIIEMGGKGEAVSGIIVMRFGENALEVIDRVKERLEELEAGLPEGVKIHTSYDRSKLIIRAIDTLTWKLGEEMIAVALVIILFLLHFRSALVAIITLPMGILLSFLVMKLLGINANIMSLGGIAIAIGVMVDASVVMVENLHKHRERDSGLGHEQVVLKAAKEVGPALFFSLLIITVSFLPVFTLEQQEGRLFSPLAYTKTFAMAAASMLLPAGDSTRVALPDSNRDPGRAAGRRLLLAGDQARLRVHAAAQRGRPALHAHHAARAQHHQGQGAAPADRQADRRASAGEARAGQDRPRRDRHRPGAAVDDRDHDPAQGQGRMARGQDDRGRDQGAGRDGPVPRADQLVDDADQDPHRHARHRDQDPGRHQAAGRGPATAVRDRPTDRSADARAAGHGFGLLGARDRR
jgi:Cu(I)/Ag(I) efflux system membrane protein CusA/SilA